MTSAHALAHDSPMARVLARLKGVKRRSDGAYLAHCPGHEDRSPSLSIREADDGRVLLNCFAGCTVEAITRAMQLEMRDLFPPKDHASNGGAPVVHRRPVLVKTYDYVDEHGMLLYQVCRFEPGDNGRPKSFLQRRPDPERTGEWIWKRGPRQVLYRLPELLEAIALERTVCIVEGEKDVETLAALGIPATTSPGGADNWRDEYAEPFAGASVVVLPDNDAVGRRHADRVSASLVQAGAASVRVLALADLPPKGDVSDWLASGGTAAQLDALLASAPTWSPGLLDEMESPPDEAASAAQAAAPRFQLLTYRDLLARPPREWQIDDVFFRHSLVGLIGAPKQGKTFVAIAIAGAMLSQEELWGKKVQRGSVLYVVAEGAHGMPERLSTYLQGHSLPASAFDGLRIVEEPVNLYQATDIDHLLRAIDTLPEPPAFAVFDTLARCTVGADENSARDMGLAIERAERFKRKTGASVMLVHHTRRDSDVERGSTSLRGAVDTHLLVKKEGGGLRLTCEEQKDAAPFAPVMLELRQVGASCFVTPMGAIGVIDAQLQPNDLNLLQSLQRASLVDGLSNSEWKRVAGLSDSSFYYSRKRLVDWGYVRIEGVRRSARFLLAPKGFGLLTPNSNDPPKDSSWSDTLTPIQCAPPIRGAKDWSVGADAVGSDSFEAESREEIRDRAGVLTRAPGMDAAADRRGSDA